MGSSEAGFLRAFARSPRRCFPMGSSKAAFCGILQGRRDDASRWARLRRLPTGFSNGGAARSAAVPFCPSLPRRPGNGCRASVPAHANRRAVPTLFHNFPLARGILLPLPCRPANDTAHGRRNNACRRARLRRPSAGFSNGGAARSAAVPFCPSLPAARPYFFLYPAVLPSDAAHGRRNDASRWARPRRLSAGFCRAAAAVLPDGLV